MMVKALERVGDSLRLLDQTRLPLETVYRELDDYHDIITAIKRLEVRGAPAIGIAAAYGVAVGVRQTGKFDMASVDQIINEIRAARPTAVNLFWALDRVRDAYRNGAPQSLEAALALLWREAEAIHAEDEAMCRRIGECGAKLIHDGDIILTHCNTGALATGGIGTALGVIYTAHQQGKRIQVYADETRPLLQGARLTVWELKEAGIPATLICDSAAGMLMAQGKIKLAIVGADRIARNGDTANKIGTYSVAVLAKEHGIPFYVAAPMSTFDPNIASGEEIVIEERGEAEVTEGFGKRTAPKDVLVYAPAFDVTPNRLITGFITDQGIQPGGRKLA